MGLRGGKYFIKVIFDIKVQIVIFKVSNVPNFNEFRVFFYFGTNLGLRGGKYFIKIVFDINIKFDMFEISNVSNFNKFCIILLLRLIWAY